MSGLNPQQAQLISSTIIKETLRDYALVPSQVLIDQQKLLAANLLKQKKQPSVYKSGMWLDAVNTYTITNQQSGNQYRYWSILGVTTVKVFSLDDADIVNLRFWLCQVYSTSTPAQIGYVLSPNDVLNQVQMDQASFLGTNQTISQVTSGSDFMQFIGEAVPCAGNRFLHLFGGANVNGTNTDLWSLISSPAAVTPPSKYNGMSYALIK
jgi:hypothetical protein